MSVFSKKAAAAALKIRLDAKRQIARIALLRNPAVKEVFGMFPLKLRTGLSLDASSFSNSIYIVACIPDLNSFKEKSFVSLLGRFIDWEVSCTDYTHNSPNKDFRFTKTLQDKVLGEFNIVVSVMAYVKSDSPLCRIVVTGVTEEVVRKEIKEIVCA